MKIIYTSHTLSQASHMNTPSSVKTELHRARHANACHRSTTQFVLLPQSVLLTLVRAPPPTHSSPIHPCWVRSTLYFTPTTSPDLRSTLYSVWSSHLTFDPHTSDPSFTKDDPPTVFPSISQSFSLWSSIFFFFFGCCCCCCCGGGGVLVVFLLCGSGFCVDSGGFSVGDSEFCDIKFVWKLRKWLRKCENFVGK